MRRSKVIVPWKEGLHLRPAVNLVRTAKKFRSMISLKCHGKIADLRSILSVLSLCAGMGMSVDVEARGDDEKEALQAVEQMFSAQTNFNSVEAKERKGLYIESWRTDSVPAAKTDTGNSP